jgi:hypothetical protein
VNRFSAFFVEMSVISSALANRQTYIKNTRPMLGSPFSEIFAGITGIFLENQGFDSDSCLNKQ